ncbi:uncharacterized protein B0P05DRAFT_527472 [Gilbertella persicaria]|uniref:uncharacterized protein n=1 Tax=Gilbertella persicaria TaxID=101096 RepID=UPI00221ECF85|nr:uncharacterized protein B0P05DRAFT_527472 [Gilbertella persicaria]KAI8091426.1 hypothetical protein B0P05DRAFT_527472 [Gilbertella persicaria]
MKFSLLLACLSALMAITLVKAGSLEDEIASAEKKFCSGLSVTGPSKGQTFTNPKNIKVTVKRTPNSYSKVITGVDAYSINSKGKATYLNTVWTGKYKLNKQASLTVDLSKIKAAKLPGQFEFRVWVTNTAGPDCTLMSKVFKVKSSSHSNAVEESEYRDLSEDIDRGCFGIELESPALGADVTAGETFSVQVKRDSAAHTNYLTGLELYKVNLETRESSKVQDSWTGKESIANVFNIKDTVPTSAKADNTAFYYKLSATTQHDETCEFYSHPFYAN